VLAAVRREALDPAELLAAVADPSCGGVALFVGAVRDSDEGRDVARLTYLVHPSAGRLLAEVAARVASLPGVRRLAVVHRTGELGLGDLAIVAAVACPHRAEAFAACERLVDEVKARVPIWKAQRFADGSEEWVGSPGSPGSPAGSGRGAGPP